MNDQKLKLRKIRAKKIIAVLKKLFPKAKIALNYHNNWELLVAVILSAQCTDKKVNEVTKKLFNKYKTLDDYLKANIKEFENDIKSTGFYHNKAKNILAAAKIIKEKFNGKIPTTMNDMLSIPGVARKTANVVLSNAYGIVEGIAVDTHVRRFAVKFDLSDYTDPVKIEKDLMQIIPKKEWLSFPYRLIEYGRQICPAKKHNCINHPLTKIYPPAANRWPKF
ncbi:MAG: endonuclease III [Minisyncoccia bacterium]